jgi:hypothetical protein
MSCTNEIPYGSGIPSDTLEPVMTDNTYKPDKLSSKKDMHGKTELDRAYEILDFFKTKSIDGTSLPAEFAIAVCGVWGAESHIATWNFNKSEHDYGGSRFRNVHAPNAGTFTYNGQKYYKDQANMMKFGYGKGVAQWSWDRPLKFRDWFNTQASPDDKRGTPFTQMDDWGVEITGTSVTTQTAFAWLEMTERTGEFKRSIKSVTHKSASNDQEGFKNNIIFCVDAVLRGFENGSKSSFASIEQINKYDGGYKGSMLSRVNRALGVYEEIKNNPRYTSWLN